MISGVVEAPNAAHQHRVAAALALGAALVSVVGVGQTWLRITIDGIGGPGSSQSGWDGTDGWTVAVAAAVASVVAAALLIGRHDVWLRVALFVTGGTILVISLVNLAGVRRKADDIHVLYGIPTGAVQAQVGLGLVLVSFAGVALIASGLIAQRTGR